jgi:hypothetical protein
LTDVILRAGQNEAFSRQLDYDLMLSRKKPLFERSQGWPSECD